MPEAVVLNNIVATKCHGSRSVGCPWDRRVESSDEVSASSSIQRLARHVEELTQAKSSGRTISLGHERGIAVARRPRIGREDPS